MHRIARATVALALLSPGLALAQQVLVVSDWRTAECPDEAKLVASIRDLRHSATMAAGVSAEVTFSVEDDGRYQAVIRIRGARRGVRTLTAQERGCDALADAVATSLALVFDEEAEAQNDAHGRDDSAGAVVGSANGGDAAQRPAPPEQVSPTKNEGSSSTPSVRAAQPNPSSEPRLLGNNLPGHLQVLASGLAEFELPLGPGIVVAPALAFAPHRNIALRMSGFFGPSHVIQASPGEVEVQMILGNLDACLAFAILSSSRLLTCGSFAAGSLQGEGRGYSSGQRQSRPYVAFGGAVHLTGRLIGPFVWDVGAEVLGALTVQTFSVGGIRNSPPYNPSRWGFLAGAGVGIQLW